MSYTCKYCFRNFINEKFVIRHQKTFKFCIELQNKYKQDELEKLKNEKSIIKNKIKKLLNENLEENIVNIENLDETKSKEIQNLFLEFQKNKNQIEDDYNNTTTQIVLKNNINENIDEYCNIDKIKMEKLKICHQEFEKSKKDIENKYEKLAIEEKIFEEQEKIEARKIDEEKYNKDLFEKYKLIHDENKNKNMIIENELNDLIKNSEITLENKLMIKNILNDIKTLKKTNETKFKKLDNVIQNNNILKNKYDEFSFNDKNIIIDNKNKIIDYNNEIIENKNEIEITELKNENIYLYEDISNDLKEYKELIENVKAHLNILLSDNTMSNKNILSIVIDLFKFINNYKIPVDITKQIIVYILKNYIKNNKIIDDYIDIFIDKYIENYINILIKIINKEIILKNKKHCFFPLCF